MKIMSFVVALLALASPVRAQPQTNAQKLFAYVQAHGAGVGGTLATREMTFTIPWDASCKTARVDVRASEASLQSMLMLTFEGAVPYKLGNKPYVALAKAQAAVLVASGNLLGVVLVDAIDKGFTLDRTQTSAMLDVCVDNILATLKPR